MKLRLLPQRKRTLTKREIARFCGQLKMLLSSGVPLLESLRIVRNILRHKEYEDLIQHISEGESLAISMKGYFPTMVTSSVESAERVGNLEEVLGRLAIYYEDRAEIEEKIKSSLVYPTFVIILCALSVVVLFLFVLPGFKSLFLDLGAELPLLSRILIGLGDLFSQLWYIPVLTIFAFAAAFSFYRRTEKGAFGIDRFFLRIRFISREYIIQGFRTLGSLLEGGISILEALKATADSSRNRAFQKIMVEVREAVENGEKLSRSLSKYRLFPQEAVQMVAVGENSGRLGEMLANIANFYEKEKELFIKRFTSMLEPILTLAVGVVVALIALAMFLPMVNMISKLQ